MHQGTRSRLSELIRYKQHFICVGTSFFPLDGSTFLARNVPFCELIRLYDMLCISENRPRSLPTACGYELSHLAVLLKFSSHLLECRTSRTLESDSAPSIAHNWEIRKWNENQSSMSNSLIPVRVTRLVKRKVRTHWHIQTFKRSTDKRQGVPEQSWHC